MSAITFSWKIWGKKVLNKGITAVVSVVVAASAKQHVTLDPVELTALVFAGLEVGKNFLKHRIPKAFSWL